MDDTMAEQHIVEKDRLSGTVDRLDLLESRVSRLEESVNTAVGTLMPKVESLLSGRTHVQQSESTFTSSGSSTSVLDLAGQGDGEALFQLLAVEQVDVRNNPPRTDKGDTALHLAASGGHLKAVVVLLGTGAKVDASGHQLRTPLHCAVAQGHLEITRLLLDVGAKVSAKDADGNSPLDLAAGQGNKDLLLLLMQKGAVPNENSVTMAAENGHWNLVVLFLQNATLVNACNKEGHPLIVLAAKGNLWEMVILLLDKGASVTKCKDPLESALVYASKSGQTDAVRELLRRGAQSNIAQVQKALSNAKSAGVVWAFVEVVPASVRGRPGDFGLMDAAIGGRLQPMIAFLEAGVNINAGDADCVTSLGFAASNGHIACVKELLKRGADIQASDKDGNTPLHSASSYDHVECMRALLDAGASTTAKNKDGKTPVEVAQSDAVRAIFNE